MADLFKTITSCDPSGVGTYFTWTERQTEDREEQNATSPTRKRSLSTFFLLAANPSVGSESLFNKRMPNTRFGGMFCNWVSKLHGSAGFRSTKDL